MQYLYPTLEETEVKCRVPVDAVGVDIARGPVGIAVVLVVKMAPELTWSLQDRPPRAFNTA